MDNFNFYSPTEFVFGKGRENEAGQLVKKYGGSKVLVHFGGGSAVRSGLLGRVTASLEAANVPYVTLGGEPERFDVVVCNYPDRVNEKTGARLNFVKRVVGLPGDTVAIRGGYLYVNGEKVDEKFLHERMDTDYGPYTVPEGRYLLMGDNRNNSNDSRNPKVGPVTRDMIVGKVEGVIWHNVPSTLEDWGEKD